MLSATKKDVGLIWISSAARLTPKQDPSYVPWEYVPCVAMVLN